MCETGIKGSVSQVASSEKLLACEKGASREKEKAVQRLLLCTHDNAQRALRTFLGTETQNVQKALIMPMRSGFQGSLRIYSDQSDF